MINFAEGIALFSLLVSSFTAFIAYQALNTWKSQFNRNLERDFLLELQRSHFLINKKIDRLGDLLSSIQEDIYKNKKSKNPIGKQLAAEITELGINFCTELNKVEKLIKDEQANIIHQQYQELISEILEAVNADQLFEARFEFTDDDETTSAYCYQDFCRILDDILSYKMSLDDYIISRIKI